MLEAIGSPKLFTVTVALLCSFLFIAGVSQPNLGAVCLQPDQIVTRFQIYRIVTAPFFHGGFMHILFNMLAWMMIARDYEKLTGTLGSFYTIFVLLIPLMAVLHCSTAYLIDGLARTSLRRECAVGISGVLFALLVVNVELSAAPSVSVFGFFSIPTRWYPLALAAVLQLLSPGLSLMGHLSGIVLGYLLVLGYLQVLTPSDYKLEQTEENLHLSLLPLWQSTSVSSGVRALERNSIPQTNQATENSGWDRMRGAWGGVTSWFSRTPRPPTAQPFEGGGRPLGGEPDPQPVSAGRIPPASRLLREVENDLKAKVAAKETNSEASESQPLIQSSSVSAVGDAEEAGSH